MHARQQILEALRNVLDAVASPPWRGVYVSGIVPAQAALPCVLVRQLSEGIERFELIHNRTQARSLTVSFLIVEKALANPEDTTARLNASAVALETALTLNAIKGELATVFDGYAQSAEINEEPDENGFVSLDLTWSLDYMTAEGAPETPLINL